MMRPLTWPASEFQVTWSPTLSFVDTRIQSSLLILRFPAAPVMCRRRPSDRHAIAVELVVLVVATWSGAQIGVVFDELDLRDPLDHLEAEFVLAAQPQRRAMQHAQRCTVHLVGQQ